MLLYFASFDVTMFHYDMQEYSPKMIGTSTQGTLLLKCTLKGRCLHFFVFTLDGVVVRGLLVGTSAEVGVSSISGLGSARTIDRLAPAPLEMP